MQNTPVSVLRLPNLKLELLETENGTSKFDLLLNLEETAQGIEGWFEYNSDLFAAATIARLARHFQTLLAALPTALATPLVRLPLLTPADLAQLHAWNATQRAFPPVAALPHPFEAQVARTPDALALVAPDTALSYAALNARANQLAHYLRVHGVGPDCPVGVCLDRSPELVIALYAILKAGGAYLPLDPTSPPDRLQFMLQDAQPPVVLTTAALAPALGPTAALWLDLATAAPALAAYPTTNPTHTVAPDHLAYILYTSGSTGQPKGVQVEHRAILNRLFWMQAEYPLTPADRVLQKTPFSFDVSVWEFFWPLMVGARLVLARPEGHKDPDYLVEVIRQEQITTLHFVPPMLSVFLLAPAVSACASLRLLFCSGEALPYETVQQCYARLPQVAVHNLYGPTEAAVDVSYWACVPDDPRGSVPIGRPVANTQLYVLDRALQPTPLGVPGELYIGGVQLARGYLNRPALTAERFIEVTADWLPEPTRLYKTGDQCRLPADGVIEYLGRLDQQVKLRGFRIELGEVEATLATHAAVAEVVVVARTDATRGAELVAYWVPRGAADGAAAGVTEAELRAHVLERLPAYMAPSAYVALAALPLTANGKVDRRALPAPAGTAAEMEDTAAPQTALEREVAAIWQAALGVTGIGRTANFFTLGGHSLLATHVIATIRERLGVDVPLHTLFTEPTIANLAAVIEQELTRSAPTKPMIKRRARGSQSPDQFIARIEGR
jgi:amino acid adenylation domain-containing protein